MTSLLLGKLVYLVGLAVAQLTLMFTWGALFFGVDLASHLPGFLIMTVVTAAACASFGLLLAAICRSRMQLVALSNLAILVMSALGGSMFPRFLMPEKMQKIGPDHQRLGHRRLFRKSSGAMSRCRAWGPRWPSAGGCRHSLPAGAPSRPAVGNRLTPCHDIKPLNTAGRRH